MFLLKFILNILSNLKKEQSKNFVIIKKNEFDWIGRIGNELVCEFNYLKDNEGYWINFMCTKEKYRNSGFGFGTKMINEAVKVYGKVFICSLSRLEFNIKKHDAKNYIFTTNTSDTRYPKDEVLMKFAKKCIAKNIIKQEWVKSPFD